MLLTFLVLVMQTANADMTKATDQEWTTKIVNLAKTCDLSPAIVEAIVRTESTYCQNTRNPASTARGCMQLLKGTAGDNYSKLDNHSESLRLGVDYLCKLKKSFPRTYPVRYHAGNGKLEALKDLVVPYLNKLDPSKNKYFTSCNEYNKLKSNVIAVYTKEQK